MYDNIGGKIKGMAKAIFVIVSIAAVIAGFAIMTVDENFIVFGAITMIVIPFIAYVSSFLLYGFGELVEKTCAIERKTRGVSNGNGGDIQSEAQEKVNSDKIRKLETLRAQGLITEEEYRQSISKLS